jgi:hypothetical protein
MMMMNQSFYMSRLFSSSVKIVVTEFFKIPVIGFSVQKSKKYLNNADLKLDQHQHTLCFGFLYINLLY